MTSPRRYKAYEIIVIISMIIPWVIVNSNTIERIITSKITVNIAMLTAILDKKIVLTGTGKDFKSKVFSF